MDWIKVTLLCLLAALLPATAVMADDDDDDDEKAAVAPPSPDDKLELKVTHFPPVPESWTMSLEDKTVIYSSPVVPKVQPEPATVLRFTYTKATLGKDARLYATDYAQAKKCELPVKRGKGFYTIGCSIMGSDVVVIGEPDNMYMIEIQGKYSKEATDLLSDYLNAIISGKRTFRDRSIGDRDYSKD